MQQPKSYLDYVKEYLGSNSSLENQQSYSRDKIRAYYVKAANDFMNNKSLENAKKEKEQAISQNNIANERARQYVNAVNKHYGIAGTGYAESKMIDLYSDFANKNNEINSNYNKQVNEITQNMVDDELEFSKLYNNSLDKQTEALDNKDTLVIDYLFSILSEEELDNLPLAISGNDYFKKLFYDKFIKKPSKYY